MFGQVTFGQWVWVTLATIVFSVQILGWLEYRIPFTDKRLEPLSRSIRKLIDKHPWFSFGLFLLLTWLVFHWYVRNV